MKAKVLRRLESAVEMLNSIENDRMSPVEVNELLDEATCELQAVITKARAKADVEEIDEEVNDWTTEDSDGEEDPDASEIDRLWSAIYQLQDKVG